MASINIKLSQATVDLLSRTDSGSGTNLSEIFGGVVETSSYIAQNFTQVNSWQSKSNSLTLNFGSGATLTFVGTAYPDFPGAPYGIAVANSKVLNVPAYFRESISGTLYYDYYASSSYLRYAPTGTSTINSYKVEKFQETSADLGTASYSLEGAVLINSSSGVVSGSVTKFTATASKVGTTTINGSFSVSGDTDTPNESVLTGTLTQYEDLFLDNSYIRFSGNLEIQSDTVLDESTFADASNFNGGDSISVILPSQLNVDYVINSGEGDDEITAAGGGGRLFVNAGAGNDNITLNDLSPVLNGGDGNDTVKSSVVSLDLRNYSSIENLTILGASALNATGNSSDNTIIGNAAANVLDGGLGADNLVGGAGNDTYLVDDLGDTILESSSGGTDLVRSSISLMLGDHLENLTLIGIGNINAVGNSFANQLTGNSGNNILDGGAGADLMAGGLGDDTYLVENAKDRIIEQADAGIDTIETRFTLASLAKNPNIENLTYSGSGNATLTGNAKGNVLTGSIGNDTLLGGLGSDTLEGGDGNDKFVFNSQLGASNIDTINDFVCGEDVLQLDDKVFLKLKRDLDLTDNFLSVPDINGWVQATSDSNDYLIFDQATGDLYYDSDANGAGASLAKVGTLNFADDNPTSFGADDISII